MLKPTVEVRVEAGALLAEFWDCLRLDPNPVTALRRHVEQHLQAGGRPELIVDLNGVEFAGSSALGGFLAIQRDLRKNNGRMVFCNVEAQVREVFRVSKLDALFHFAVDVPAAQALLGSGGSEGPSGNGTPLEGAPAAGPVPEPNTANSSPPRPGSSPPLRLRRRPG